jgi:hypothetical protein
LAGAIHTIYVCPILPNWAILKANKIEEKVESFYACIASVLIFAIQAIYWAFNTFS